MLSSSKNRPFTFLFDTFQPKDGRLEHVYNTLTNAHPNMTVYKKDEFPEFWHYARHPRIPSLIALADPGFVVYTVS